MYTIELTEQEMTALSGLLDAGVRATGIRACKDAAVLLEKMEKALASDDSQAASNGTGKKKKDEPQVLDLDG